MTTSISRDARNKSWSRQTNKVSYTADAQLSRQRKEREKICKNLKKSPNLFKIRFMSF